MAYIFALILLGMAIGFMQIGMLIGLGHLVTDFVLKLIEKRRIDRGQTGNGF